NQSMRLSSADVLNVVNGNVICTFEPADLEDLRRENSLSFCCIPLTREQRGNVVQRVICSRCLKPKRKKSPASLQQQPPAITESAEVVAAASASTEVARRVSMVPSASSFAAVASPHVSIEPPVEL